MAHKAIRDTRCGICKVYFQDGDFYLRRVVNVETWNGYTPSTIRYEYVHFFCAQEEMQCVMKEGE